MRKKKVFLVLTILLNFTYNSIGQNVAKTIIIDSLYLSAADCYGSNADPAIVIDCISGEELYRIEWKNIDLDPFIYYDLFSAPIDGDCTFGTSFVLDPVSTEITTLSVYIETFESDDNDCHDYGGGLDDCVVTASMLLDISAGAHSFSVGTTTYYYTVTEVATVSVGLVCGLPLPIELINFNVFFIENSMVKVDWQTSSEINNDYFTIERSLNAIDWEEVKSIKGSGNSTSLLSYSSFDENPYSGISYYRLKQTDFDGQFEYSKVRSILIDELIGSRAQVYPNPSENIINIIGDKIELKQLTIYNVLGQNVTSLTKEIVQDDTKLIIDLSDLESGFYYIKTKTTVNKIYKQ